MVYVDWGYYAGVFGGERVPEEAFERVAGRASRELDMLTFGRIDGVYAGTDAVKMACCAVSDVIWGHEEDGGRQVSRERLDAVEVAYENEGSLSLKRRVLEAARLYLWHTGLLSMAVKAHGGLCPPYGTPLTEESSA